MQNNNNHVTDLLQIKYKLVKNVLQKLVFFMLL